MPKYIILVFSLLLSTYFFSAWWRDELIIVFCDVGQGDATLLSQGSTQLLIDAGPNNAVLDCLEKNMPFWDKKIEFFVLTHMDRDHIYGAPQVLDAFAVDYLFINPSNKKTSDFNLLEEALSRKGNFNTRIVHTFIGQQIVFSDTIVTKVVSPDISFPQVEGQNYISSETILSDENSYFLHEKLTKNNENDLSIALFVQFKDIIVFLPGDLESGGELALLKSGLLKRVSVLKAGHHGSKSSSTPGFIEVLQPEITAISSGRNNVYNHPNPQVIDILTRFGSNIYQTQTSGQLVFTADGHKFWQTGVSGI